MRIGVALVGLVAAAACAGREASLERGHPPAHVRLIGCAPAISPPILNDDGVTFGGLPREHATSRPRPRGPRVVIGAPTQAAGVDPEVLARVIRRERPALDACYARELARKPDLQARLSIAFTIESDGSVSQATTGGLAPPGLSQCVVRILSALRFPALVGGGRVRVAYPFNFEPAGPPGVPPPREEPRLVAPNPPGPSDVPPPGTMWTPFAVAAVAAVELAPKVAQASEAAVRARLPQLDACFPPGAPTGSLRAMLAFDADGALESARVGGLGARDVEACVRRALAGLHVVTPTHDGVEVACDLSRGDAERWRVATDAGYQVITASRTALAHGGQTLAPGPSEPTPLPGGATYLVIAEPETPGTLLELALAWADDGEPTLLALAVDHGPPVFLGLARSAHALGDDHDVPGAADVMLELDAHRLSACVGGSSQDAALSDRAAQDALLAKVASRCRKVRCSSSIGLALDGEARAADLLPVVDVIRRAGFARIVIGSPLGCRRDAPR